MQLDTYISIIVLPADICKTNYLHEINLMSQKSCVLSPHFGEPEKRTCRENTRDFLDIDFYFMIA